MTISHCLPTQWTLRIALCSIFFSAAHLLHSVQAQVIAGTNVVPHTQSDALRWRRPPNPELAARVELYLHNPTEETVKISPCKDLQFDGLPPDELLETAQWAWHDTPAVWKSPSLDLPPGSMLVWKFNGRSAKWGINTHHEATLPNQFSLPFSITTPTAWISAVTFLTEDSQGNLIDQPIPNRLVIHVENAEHESLKIKLVRLWTADQDPDRRVYRPVAEYSQPKLYPVDGSIPAGDKGIIDIQQIEVPLTHVIVQVLCDTSLDDNRFNTNGPSKSLWATMKVKSEQFDISGGWISSQIGTRNSLTIEEYLMTLARMHIDTGHFQEVSGYTDNPDLYARFPMKRFHRLANLEKFDSDQYLPAIHAVEFIGEPQFGGGTPVPPQEVWQLLEPYRKSRLPTSVTLSEERNWRYYAGLSDFPHYDAYRVVAPAADWWRAYDWGDEKISWGSPLETIGDMTRSLRDLSRPAPIAYWSQGAHDGWGSIVTPRRGSPTPDELRSQAWHGLANRITSLYWFNLSLKSLLKFPDLIEPINRVNREIRLLDEVFLLGDAFEYRRLHLAERPAWDLCSIATNDTLLMTAHDLSYTPNLTTREFNFDQREAEWSFNLPSWFQGEVSVFRIDADGPRDVAFQLTDGKVTITDSIRVVGIYLATTAPDRRKELDAKYRTIIAREQSIGFDPGNRPADLDLLRTYMQ